MNIKYLRLKIREKQNELNDLLNDLSEQLSLEEGDYSQLSLPQGATHYRIFDNKVQYIKKCRPYRDDWYIWDGSKLCTTLWKRVEVGREVKLLIAK